MAAAATASASTAAHVQPLQASLLASVSSMAKPWPSALESKRRSSTPPARMPSARGGSSPMPSHRSFGGYSHKSWRTADTPRAGTPSRADVERARVEQQRRAAAQAAKQARLEREYVFHRT